MKKKLIIFSLLLIITISFLPLSKVQALDSTNSANTASSSASTDQNSLANKINALKAEIASKAANFKFDVNKKIENKAYVGFVKDVSPTQITLATKNGNKNVIINEFTIYQNKTNTKLTVKNVDKEDYIICLGDLDDKNNLVAKKILWQIKPTDSTSKIFWGQIQTLTPFKIKSKDQTLNIFTNANTDFAAGNEEAQLSDLRLNSFIAGVGNPNKDNISAEYIFIITPKR